jgi:hypothetical protein
MDELTEEEGCSGIAGRELETKNELRDSSDESD